MPPPSGHVLTHSGAAEPVTTGDHARQIGGHGHGAEGGDRPTDCPHADVEVRVRAPVTVVTLLHAAIETSRAPGEPVWRGFERVLLHAQVQWLSGSQHRDPVFERDGWRCAAPVCTSRRNLQDHHIEFRSQGGGNELGNRITLCAWHHLRGIHGGRVRLRGAVGDGLHWQIGLRRDGPALITTIGEEYVSDGGRAAAGQLSPEELAGGCSCAEAGEAALRTAA